MARRFQSLVGRSFVGRLSKRRGEQAAIRRDSLKAQIVHQLQLATSKTSTVAYVHEKAFSEALRLSATELQPLLDELVAEGRIFRGVLLRTYTIWYRAPGTSIRKRGPIPIGGDLDVVRRRDPMWRLRRSDKLERGRDPRRSRGESLGISRARRSGRHGFIR